MGKGKVDNQTVGDTFGNKKKWVEVSGNIDHAVLALVAQRATQGDDTASFFREMLDQWDLIPEHVLRALGLDGNEGTEIREQ